MTEKRKKGVSIMLDADITTALELVRANVTERVNEAGFHGLSEKLTIGYLAREMLRQHMGLASSEGKYWITEGVDHATDRA